MTNAMLELTDSLVMDYYFVSLEVKEGQLFLYSLNNYCKPISKTIELTQIDGLHIEDSGGLGYICFDFDNDHYHFVDYGNHILSFFKTILFPITLHQ
ncbi:hypothetical protein [Enterococcus termitis]|uniref:Uncharacterized protein n=1 Tax=Enterococcus termitis TaxID=332950 RepID=A0A1E5GVA4_9ENTE|nr:hypothetical protein [Enterococcus termitis]OEG16599.1 hypothetical protein BCR25_03090 [Enterococcus termitis]OJG99280.1 hypothetical protein RV18_GL001348 [Enterococcus termitis]